MDFRYRSSVGIFLIRHLDPGCELSVDGIPLGTYDSVESAYQDVARQSTGWDEWDLLNQADIPDLDKWETVDESTRH
jgi:hypothetical protein